MNGVRQFVHRTRCWIHNKHTEQSAKDEISPIPAINISIKRCDLIAIAISFIRDSIKLTIKITRTGLQSDLSGRYARTNYHPGLVCYFIGSARWARLD